MSKSSTATTFEKRFSCLFPEWCSQRSEKKSGQLLKKLPAGDEVPRRRQGLFKFFGHHRERELGLGERLDDGGLGVFG